MSRASAGAPALKRATKFGAEANVDAALPGNLFYRFDLALLRPVRTGARTGGETEMVHILDSTLDSVDSAETLALRAARSAGLDEDELQKIAMAVRESMVNAVVHGNRYSTHKKVRLSISHGPKHLTLKIADEGEGFDYDHLPDPLAPENLLRSSGRGIFLIRAFMDEFQVRRLKPAGTEVTLIKYLMTR